MAAIMIMPETNPIQRKGEPEASISLASGRSIVQAARAASVSERTLRRRLQRPEYRMEVARLRSRMLDLAVGKLVAGAAAAADELIRLAREGKSEACRVSAAKAVLEYSLSLQEATEVQGRIAALEQLVTVRHTTTRVRFWPPEV